MAVNFVNRQAGKRYALMPWLKDRVDIGYSVLGYYLVTHSWVSVSSRMIDCVLRFWSSFSITGGKGGWPILSWSWMCQIEMSACFLSSMHQAKTINTIYGLICVLKQLGSSGCHHREILGGFPTFGIIKKIVFENQRCRVHKTNSLRLRLPIRRRRDLISLIQTHFWIDAPEIMVDWSLSTKKTGIREAKVWRSQRWSETSHTPKKSWMIWHWKNCWFFQMQSPSHTNYLKPSHKI